ncbi:pimeloyl-ACP methyl ester esterase BioH [Glaciecola sp. KUL10]|uniref:pimeloyl-ACP methyl ester esterase BioH n=1 Tax=Glaciecola sp. (strain KUL10) TaxID=2161813 RepID=UPI000D783DE5|nr:pimeloyl-ACP methyl ester esterase BioH [Glaciecola sp. KUL10]GBL04362.1 BioH protein [Glaciecola sp. KUL10]
MNQLSSLSSRSEPTLVFLHGWGMNSGVWTSLTNMLNKHVKCQCIDLPGYGDAHDVDVTPEHYNLVYLANWVETRLPENSILVGWSLGGLVAQKIAIDDPSKLSGLVCIASTPKFEESHDWLGIKPNVLDLFHRQLSDDHGKTLNRFLAIQMQGIADISARKAAIRTLSERLLSKPSPNPALLDAGLSLLSTVDLREAIGKIVLPTLRIYGRLDLLIPYKVIEKIADLHPNSTSIVHKKASHAPFVTDCEQIYDDIMAFLNQTQLTNSIDKK